MTTATFKKKPKLPAYRMKATVWTPEVKTEISGPIPGCIELAFMGVDSAKVRQNLLAKLYQDHVKRMDQEAEREAERAKLTKLMSAS